jgi:predicted amidohydrolase
MTRRISALCLLLVLAALTAFAGDGNLIKNPGFQVLDETQKSPAGWRQVFPRAEVAPLFARDGMPGAPGKFALRLSAQGSAGTFGYWATTVEGIRGSSTPTAPEKNAPQKEPPVVVERMSFLGDRSYRFRCSFLPKQVESVSRNIMLRIRWKDGKGEEVMGEFVSRYARDGEWYKVDQVLTAPKSAVAADIELVLRWSERGSVLWGDLSFEETATALRKKIKVATVSFQPPSPSTTEANLRFFAAKVAEAGKAGADIVCLGEGITVVSTKQSYADVAESIPGPTSRAMGEVAKAHHLYVVAGIYEREGALVYNTALLIGRDGAVVGKYRKTHLPINEVNGGITPGTQYPVFSTDFGVIGIEICYDNFFPEVARMLALNGAEMVFVPIWGDLRGDGYEWDIVARSRAIDNSIYLVASNYSNKRSLIIDPDGRILADTGGKSGIVMADVDLGARTFGRWMWFDAYGDWKSQYPAERRTETYGPLLEDRMSPGTGRQAARQ